MAVNVLHRPDPITTLLEVAGLQGAVRCWAVASGDWGFHVGGGPRVFFHIVGEGQCWVVHRGEAHALTAGDLVLLPHGGGHRVVSDPSVESIHAGAWHEQHAHDLERPPPAGPHARLICGTYTSSHRELHPLLRRLPPLLLIKADEVPADAPLTATLDAIVREFRLQAMGMSGIVERLLDILLALVVRYWAEQEPDHVRWIEALCDPTIGTAIGLFQNNLAHKWTQDEMARALGISRPVLSRRFRERLGESPLQFLTRARIEMAAELLREGSLGVAEIAQRVGYDSDSALSRAFKRVRGVPPRAYRESAPTQATGAYREFAPPADPAASRG